MQIEHKIAIVSGASRGLGAAIAKALVGKGALVYGLARSSDLLNKLQTELGNHFVPVVLDITQQAQVKKWVQQTFSENHPPSILINNAGVGTFAKVDETTTEAWTNQLSTNLNGLFYLTSAISPLMKASSQSAHIINIGSILSNVARTDATAYCASKFGVRGFTEALMLELRHFNIKVTGLYPGSIETDFLRNSGIEPHHNMLHVDEIANTILHLLETPDNLLIDSLTMRPLNPKKP
jgi:NADP-dependent 3-hydroxy acid dehydrogenase YdfG